MQAEVAQLADRSMRTELADMLAAAADQNDAAPNEPPPSDPKMAIAAE